MHLCMYHCGQKNVTYTLHINNLSVYVGPPPPENLTVLCDYSNITETGLMVTLMWSEGLGEVNVDHTLLLTSSSNNSLTTHTTSATNWTTSLQFAETYLVTLYSSTCDHTLISDNYTTNITIDECEEPSIKSSLH
jgi:hypothetical protein